jgi:Kef-type K+ transport system membrane component KefB
MTGGIFELAIVILIAAALGIAAKLLRQPIILAYLVAGALIGFFGWLNFGDREFFRVFSDLGIMFLLFLVGLEINYTSLRMVGKASILVGLGQIIFTFLFGFLIGSYLFGFDTLTAAYIAIALTFSSTIIIVKLLSEKKEFNSLYGKISIGFLLIQDFVAILILIFLAGIEVGEGLVFGDLIFTILKGLVLFGFMLWLGRRIFPFIFDKIARSQELLFLTSLAWMFLVVALVDKINFSIEIGGFLAGLALANSSENFQIASRIKSLRDFFILIFFVILGSSLIFSGFGGLTLPIIIFSLFVLIGNPLIVLAIMGIMGYRKRTSFLAGVTVAQISEFSLILAALGLKLGHITEDVVALVTAVGVITITISTYMIIHANSIFRRLSKFLALFERKVAIKETQLKEYQKPVILIGAHLTGQSVARHMAKEQLLIIDFNPEVIDSLERAGFDYIFGDISDFEIFERANISQARLVISTSPDFETNFSLLTEIMRFARRPKVILRAETEKEAEFLYERGADYVLVPEFTSGHYLAKVLAGDAKLESLQALKERDLHIIKKEKII